MSAISPAPSHPVLVDRLLPRSLAVDTVLVVAGAALTAGFAQLTIPMWPVPITGQTFAVLLVGTVLGSLRGALSLGLYLLAGVLGAPVFAGGASGSVFALPSGGFIVGFIAAAALVGWLAQREWDRKVLRTVVSFLAGTVVIYAIGLPWLAAALNGYGESVWHGSMGYDSVFAATLGTGLLPFILGDVIKALIAGAVLPLAWRGVRTLDARR